MAVEILQSKKRQSGTYCLYCSLEIGRWKENKRKAGNGCVNGRKNHLFEKIPNSNYQKQLVGIYHNTRLNEQEPGALP